MSLREYFENTRGRGVLATADADGRVDAAVYARPHAMDDGTVAFIMADRLSHRNLESNPHAAYLFFESGEGYAGKRLFLTRMREEKDSPLIETLRRRCSSGEDSKGTRYLVFFRVDRVLPLVGSGE